MRVIGGLAMTAILVFLAVILYKKAFGCGCSGATTTQAFGIEKGSMT